MARLAWRITLWSIPLFWVVLRIMGNVLWSVTRGASLLALAGIGGLVTGIPQSTQQLADDWSRQIVAWGIPLPTVERLNPMLRVWGFILIFIGWVVIGFLVAVVVIWVT